MKKFYFFKLFTLLLFLFFSMLPVNSKDIEFSNISRVVIDPIYNNTYTLNIYFDNLYKGKAFIQRNSDGSYFVFLPDTTINNKKVKILYKNKSDRKNIRLSIDQKPYINNEIESNYVRIYVNMNADYSLKLLSKDSKNDKFIFFTNNSINNYSLILLGCILAIYLMFRKLSKLIKINKTTNSYTSFPESFYIKKNYSSDNIKFNKNLKYKPNKFITRPDIGAAIRTADKTSFACFDVPLIINKINTNAYEYKSSIKQTSNILRNRNHNNLQKTNSINYNEAQELDLPSVDELKKDESKNQEKKAELISILNITPNKGFYLTTVDDTMALFGFIGENVFLLQKFADLSQINLQARFYDKNGDNDVFIVRLDSYKAMIEISNDSMKELAVL